MKSKLKPLDFTEDNTRYKAHNEKTKIKMPTCDHSKAKYDKHRAEIRCTCGNTWRGGRLGELATILKIA